jgi:hypothetical protein
MSHRTPISPWSVRGWGEVVAFAEALGFHLAADAFVVAHTQVAPGDFALYLDDEVPGWHSRELAAWGFSTWCRARLRGAWRRRRMRALTSAV